jgi:hypothetical protein
VPNPAGGRAVAGSNPVSPIDRKGLQSQRDAARDLVPWHPTEGDVDSPRALADYQAAKRVHKAEWSKAKTPT